VDDGVHTADRIHLVRDASRLDGAGEVADDDTSRAGGKIVDRRGARRRPRMQHDLMALRDERACCGTAQAVRAAGDEHARHPSASRPDSHGRRSRAAADHRLQVRTSGVLRSVGLVDPIVDSPVARRRQTALGGFGRPMRKLLTTLNAMIKHQQRWLPVNAES
jgi:hypothetical protein